ncbi:adenylate kinase 9 isoform X2 [Nelusetta ayraudi]|uniref:adenylate kinase 9 isoform X2 n=1 Tax=Nelusetta ayraudi TaxID=303726 RepID=UPI003F6E705C
MDRPGKTGNPTQMDNLVDTLMEDESERESLVAKPICFIIIGRPGVGKTTLAKRVADSWKCILIDDTTLLETHIKNKTKEGTRILNILSRGRSLPEELVLELILARINSADVQHYGYVLSCLPFLSDGFMRAREQLELIKNLKMAPDFIINIKCADKDLVERLAGLKQLPETGQLFTRSQWQREISSYRTWDGDDDLNDTKVEENEANKEERLPKQITDQLVWVPEYEAKNSVSRINIYRDTILRPLEDYMAEHNLLYILELDGHARPDDLNASVMFRLGSMAIKCIPVPAILRQTDKDEPGPDVETDELLRLRSSAMVVASGFRWRRSRWGRNCPVALKEGHVVPGQPEFSVSFLDKMYILSSEEAYQKFITNPRPYLLPPMPRFPCRVCIIGPPQAGTTTLCRLLAQSYNALVLDVDELLKPVLSKEEQERIDKIKEEATLLAIDMVKRNIEEGIEQTSDETNPEEVTENHPAVQAMVLTALEEAKPVLTSPTEPISKILKRIMQEIAKADSEAGVSTGWVLDNFPTTMLHLKALQEDQVSPDMLFCLTDSEEKNVLKRMYEKNKETIDEEICQRLKDEATEKIKQSESQKKQKPEAHVTDLETVIEEDEGAGEAEEQLDQASAFPASPEMEANRQKLQQFMANWEEVKSGLTCPHTVLEVGGKNPEELLQEIVDELQKPFQHVSWVPSAVDKDEEEEDMQALTELQTPDVPESEDPDVVEAEYDIQDMTALWLLGDTRHFCPVALKNNNVLFPCTDKEATKYREKLYYFSSPEAKDSFIENPAQYVASTGPLQPPALRMFCLGNRGAGKTTLGVWLAKQLGIFHIKFREQLQMVIVAKNGQRVPYSDEVESKEDLTTQIKQARRAAADEEEEEEEKEDTESQEGQGQPELELTEDERAITAYLSTGESLNAKILDIIVKPLWQQEPYRSTGFILEGFPSNTDEVEYLLQQQLFPDLVLIMEANIMEVQKRLLPSYLDQWRKWQRHLEEQITMLRQLRLKNREESMAKRRAEMMAEFEAKFRNRSGDEEDEEDDEDDEDNEELAALKEEIEAMLEDEFPPEEDPEDILNREHEEAAIQRLEMDIEERFMTDENNLALVMELLAENNIAKVLINASRKLGTVRKQLLQKTLALQRDREALLLKCQPISYSLAQMLLMSSYKFYSAFGCWDPVKQYNEGELVHSLPWPLSSAQPLIFNQYIYFFNSVENRKTFTANPLKYLRQPKPNPCVPIKMAVVGPPKSGKTTVAQMFAQKYGLARLSIGSVMRMVLNTHQHTELAAQMKSYLFRGLTVPDELAVQCLEVAFLSLICNTRGYVLDGFPNTIKQAELLGSRNLIPLVIFELELETVEVLKRGLADKMKPNKPHPKHDSSEIIHIRNICYKQEVAAVRHFFKEEYQNWIPMDGQRSQWWIWNSILKEVSISMKNIHSYLERRNNKQAACINRLCITPRELQSRLGEFGHYCPICLALLYHLTDCSETKALTHGAEYRGRFYRTCGKEHLELFLDCPDDFLAPNCPHNLPPPHFLPRKLTGSEVRNRFPQQAHMKGFCPVTFLDGKQRYEALVQGKMEFAVEYREQIYFLESRQKQDRFMRTPETYWELKLPIKIPPLSDPVPLTSLPTLGYLEQGVAVTVIKAMTAVGRLKPKYPFLTVKTSALIYVAFYLKAFNHKSPTYIREIYKKKLALFEENCALIPYLCSSMRGNYKPLSERPLDYEFKLHKFLALRNVSGKSSVL